MSNQEYSENQSENSGEYKRADGWDEGESSPGGGKEVESSPGGGKEVEGERKQGEAGVQQRGEERDREDGRKGEGVKEKEKEKEKKGISEWEAAQAFRLMQRYGIGIKEAETAAQENEPHAWVAEWLSREVVVLREKISAGQPRTREGGRDREERWGLREESRSRDREESRVKEREELRAEGVYRNPAYRTGEGNMGRGERGRAGSAEAIAAALNDRM